MSSPNPNFSLGMSCGPSRFFEPPGLRLPDRLPLWSLRASALSVVASLTRVPMLGIDLVVGFWSGGLAFGSVEGGLWEWAEVPLAGSWGSGEMRRGSIFESGGVEASCC